VTAEASRGVAALTRVEAILRNPETYALAAAVPTPPKCNGGRPRDHPDFMVFVYEALISVYGSARQVEAELAHRLVWRLVQRHVAKRTGTRLPGAPMRRHHYLYLRNRYLTQDHVQAQLGELHREHAAGCARRLGLLNPDGPGSWTHPHPTRSLYGDGKVITPLYRAHPGDTRLDKETGELIPRRFEPDGGLHFEGTGETAWGTKFVLIAARGPAPRQRVILDAAFVAKPGAEAATATDAITRVAPLVPGAQSVIYDTALRGVHHQTLLRDLGLIPINRVSAAKAGSRKARRSKADQRQEKSTLIDTKTVNGETVSLYARAGQIGIGQLDDTGTMAFTPLKRVRTHRNADKAGRYRWYNDYELPVHHGGGSVTVRLHGNDEDTKRKFNRTENVRPIPPADPDFPGLFRQRNDAESINRGLDDTLFLRRAHSLGHRRQWLNLLGYALTVNSLALHEHEQQPSAAIAA
jgi:hypothetical protein